MIQRFATHLSSGSVPARDANGIYGRDIAVQSLIESLWAHSRIPENSFFFTGDPRTNESRAQTLLTRTLKPRHGKRAEICNIETLKHNFDAFDFDVWHDFDAGLAEVAAMRSRFSQRLFPISTTVHVLSYQSILAGLILDLLLHRLYPCDAVICTTHSCKNALTNLLAHVADRFNAEFATHLQFAGQLEVIPYCIDTDLFRPGRRHEAREILNLPRDAFIIGWIGRLSPVDKADLLPLLQVFSSLVKTNPDRPLMLLLAGTGPQVFRTALLRCAADLDIAEKIKIIAPLPPESRADVHAALDIFTSPIDNLQETAGITPLEAMSSGVPQVLADWNGYREAVEHGKTGFLVATLWAACDDDISRESGIYDDYDLMDHYALAQSVVLDRCAYQQAFQVLLDNDVLRAEMGVAARARALGHYSPAVVVQQHEALWERLIEVARREDFAPPRLRRFDEPAFFRNFQYYPASIIAESAKLRMTRLGLQTHLGERKLPFYYETVPGLTAENLALALDLLHNDAGEFSMSTLRVADSLNISESRARRHILWLLKYGLLEIWS